MLQESQKNQVRKKLGGMRDPVSILLFTQELECAFCRETHELLEEVASLTDKIELRVFDFQADKSEAEKYRIDKIPGIVIKNQKDAGIRNYGIPAGYEFASLLEDLLMVSRGDSSLSGRSRELLKSLQQPVHIQVFVTPT